LIARRMRAKGPVPPFVLVIARIPVFLFAPLCVRQIIDQPARSGINGEMKGVTSGTATVRGTFLRVGRRPISPTPTFR
jgi:hypothetical protein